MLLFFARFLTRFNLRLLLCEESEAEESEESLEDELLESDESAAFFSFLVVSGKAFRTARINRFC